MEVLIMSVKFRIIENADETQLERNVLSDYNQEMALKEIWKKNDISKNKLYRILREYECKRKPIKNHKIPGWHEKQLDKVLSFYDLSFELFINRLANYMISLTSFAEYSNLNEHMLVYIVKKRLNICYLDFVSWKQGYIVSRFDLLKFNPSVLKED
jgi:hypothetical protein